MTPFVMAAVAILNVVAKGLEMRMRQYEANPALLEADAAAAGDMAKAGRWLIKMIVKMFADLGLDPPGPDDPVIPGGGQ